MITHCEVCKLEIVAEDIVVTCELCDDLRQFHARCVGLSYDEGCACLHQNIFWMCDSCRDGIERGRFRKSSIEKSDNDYATRDDLKSEIKRISSMVSQLVTGNDDLPNETTVDSPIVRALTNRFPLSSTKLNAGNLTTQTPNDANLQLYVTNIAPDVTTSEVKQMVCQSIGADDVLHIKCLAPSWQNVSTLNFISFKVTVDALFRDAAFRTTNWPSGVRCREFREMCNSAWRPSSLTI